MLIFNLPKLGRLKVSGQIAQKSMSTPAADLMKELAQPTPLKAAIIVERRSVS